MTLRVAAVGECMIELSQDPGGQLALAYGGDTLNTAVYLKRVAAAALHVDYVTALGDDPWSEAMLASWRGEALGTAHVARLPGRLPGLYAIRLDDKGERRFFYWRSAAAARELFRAEETLAAAAALSSYDLVYFSLVTLSILAPEARGLFDAALRKTRAAGRDVAFDTNYRPAAWPDAEAARAEVRRFMRLATIALPTFDDEAALFGDSSPEETARRCREELGVREVAVKLGAEGCLAGGARIAVPERVDAVDTTAAGDAFNAGYLAARLRGKPPQEAALAGHRVAGAVVRHRGAIIPRAATPTI